MESVKYPLKNQKVYFVRNTKYYNKGKKLPINLVVDLMDTRIKDCDTLEERIKLEQGKQVVLRKMETEMEELVKINKKSRDQRRRGKNSRIRYKRKRSENRRNIFIDSKKKDIIKTY